MLKYLVVVEKVTTFAVAFGKRPRRRLWMGSIGLNFVKWRNGFCQNENW